MEIDTITRRHLFRIKNGKYHSFAKQENDISASSLALAVLRGRTGDSDTIYTFVFVNGFTRFQRLHVS